MRRTAKPNAMAESPGSPRAHADSSRNRGASQHRQLFDPQKHDLVSLSAAQVRKPNVFYFGFSPHHNIVASASGASLAASPPPTTGLQPSPVSNLAAPPPSTTTSQSSPSSPVSEPYGLTAPRIWMWNCQIRHLIQAHDIRLKLRLNDLEDTPKTKKPKTTRIPPLHPQPPRFFHPQAPGLPLQYYKPVAITSESAAQSVISSRSGQGGGVVGRGECMRWRVQTQRRGWQEWWTWSLEEGMWGNVIWCGIGGWASCWTGGCRFNADFFRNAPLLTWPSGGQLIWHAARTSSSQASSY